MRQYEHLKPRKREHKSETMGKGKERIEDTMLSVKEQKEERE